MGPEAVTPTASPGIDRRQVIESLEAQLATIPPATRPHEHAAVAYRLGLAYAESPPGTPTEGLRKALACYSVAASLFDPRFDPVEHARVLNAAGAAHRGLGDRHKAAELFEKAAGLLEGRDRDAERAAALNNLGLVRTELGRLDPAVEAFDAAVELFDTTTAEGRRGRVATLHNRGQAHAALGTEEGLDAALADYEQARSELQADEAPYHSGLVHHSMGVACTSLAGMRPAQRERLLEQAVQAFGESLGVFTRSTLPYQHALAKYNLGLAHAARGGVQNLRRALACFEDAVAVLDPRLHADAWRQAYTSLSRVEEELAPTLPEPSRAAHFAALLAESEPDERLALVRERLVRLLALPEPRRRAALVEMALVGARLGPEVARPVVEGELSVLMELPTEGLETALRARLEAHRQLGEEEREQADRTLDEAVGFVLGAPQRIFVRDFLYSLGWERP